MSMTTAFPMARSSVDDRLRSLLEEYGHVLRRAIQRVIPRDMGPDIDDIEQEARLKVWRAIQKETVFEKPASYLYRVAVHATLDAVNKRSARREQPLEASYRDQPGESSSSPERAAAGRETIHQVKNAMARLPPNRRRAVGLHLQGFTTTEIGDFYGWSEAKARNLAYRGLGDLRRQLAREREHREHHQAI